jgi:hypothetical protein
MRPALPSPKNSQSKMDYRCVAQAVEHLLRKHEAPSSNPNPSKKKKKKEIFTEGLLVGKNSLGHWVYNVGQDFFHIRNRVGR